jgi:hypothetical protein
MQRQSNITHIQQHQTTKTQHLAKRVEQYIMEKTHTSQLNATQIQTSY